MLPAIIGRILYILAALVALLISYKLIRPFRVHRRRKWSTIYYKLSFLLYLAVLFVFVYWYSFYAVPQSSFTFDENILKYIIRLSTGETASFYLIRETNWMYLLAFVINGIALLPLLAMLIRKTVRFRVTFNVFFTLYQLSVIVGLLFYFVRK